MSSSGSTYARVLGEFAARTDYEALPPPAIAAVRRHTLDTLGAAIGGALQPEPEAALGAGRGAFGAGGQAVVFGRDDGASPGLAALVNGTAAHALELDDASGCDHSGAVVVPATFAALALPNVVASERDVVAAIAVGYDVGRRVMEAAGGYDGHNGAGWHSTGTCGVFGAAAAVARVLRCDAGQTAHALGIAASFASGTWAFLADGAMTKRLHPGHAASAGLLAVTLARGGLTGPSLVFEADWGGFFKTYAPASSQPDALIDGLGHDWRIHRSSIKPYASCRGTHAAVDAVLQLRREMPVEDVASVVVSVTPTVEKMCRGKEIRTFVDAQMSLPYAIAVAFTHGAAGADLFDAEHRQQEQIRHVMDRVEVRAIDGLPSNVAARLEVRGTSGSVRSMAVDVPLGSPGNPLPQQALMAKFHSLADAVLGTNGAAALEERILKLGEGGDARDVPALARKPHAKDPQA